ncbi:MAG: hypothetical protein HGA87_00710 [Desulfobulbaceae bacterium]|nr:hypothetical protein [Desulfobulbaceae bacterium]
MNFLPAIFGTSATAGAATTAGTAAAASAGAAGTVSLLSAGATVFSALSGMQSMNLQAQQADLQAISLETQGIEKSNALREEFLKNLSSSQALFGASGTSLSTGDPLNAALESTKNIEKETSKVSTQAKITKNQSLIQGMQYRADAKSTAIIGGMKAAKTLLGY